MSETNSIFSGLDSFLKSNNSAQGGISLSDLEAGNESAEIINLDEPEVLNDGDNKEKKGSEKPEVIGLTLEELEAGETEEETVVEDDNDSSTKAEKSKGAETVETTEEEGDVWKEMSKLFKEKGIVEDDFDSEEKMVEVFGKEVDKGVNDWIDNLPEEVKSIVTAAAEGLNGQSLLSFIENKDHELQLDAIDDSRIEAEVDLAKALVRNHLKTTTKFNDTKIEKLITQMEDMDELVDEAKEAKTVLSEISKEKQAEALKQHKLEQAAETKRNANMINEVKKVVDNTAEIIPGIKLSAKEQQELHKMIVTPVELRGNVPVSAAMKLREADPIKFELMLNYFIKEGFFEGKFDKINKKAETKVTTKIQGDLEAAAKKLMNKTVSTTREETNPDAKVKSVAEAWKTRKK